MNKRMPLRLEKCPLVDALIEIRFESPDFVNAYPKIHQ